MRRGNNVRLLLISLSLGFIFTVLCVAFPSVAAGEFLGEWFSDSFWLILVAFFTLQLSGYICVHSDFTDHQKFNKFFSLVSLLPTLPLFLTFKNPPSPFFSAIIFIIKHLLSNFWAKMANVLWSSFPDGVWKILMCIFHNFPMFYRQTSNQNFE